MSELLSDSNSYDEKTFFNIGNYTVCIMFISKFAD